MYIEKKNPYLFDCGISNVIDIVKMLRGRGKIPASVFWESSMWRHASTNDDINVKGPVQENCVFCGTGMMMEVIENKWEIDEEMERPHVSEDTRTLLK